MRISVSLPTQQRQRCPHNSAAHTTVTTLITQQCITALTQCITAHTTVHPCPHNSDNTAHTTVTTLLTQQWQHCPHSVHNCPHSVHPCPHNSDNTAHTTVTTLLTQQCITAHTTTCQRNANETVTSLLRAETHKHTRHRVSHVARHRD